MQSVMENLLDTKISSLKLPLKGSWLAPYLKQLKQELKDNGLFSQIHFWVSDEWFCPDGVSGIALPFYLLDVRLTRLEKKMVHEVEGATPKQVMKLLRHEAGHVMDNVYGLRRKKIRQRLFGLSSRKYPYCYYPKADNNKYVSYVYPSYAHSHPDEDWAETFATWLDPNSNWRKKYSCGAAREKLNYVDELMKGLRGKREYKINKEQEDSYKQIHMTLADYYRAKRKKLGLERTRKLTKEFSLFFAKNGEFEKASSYLRKEKTRIISGLREQGEINEIQANVVLEKMIAYCREEDLKLKKDKSALERNFVNSLVKKWDVIIKRKEHRVIM